MPPPRGCGHVRNASPANRVLPVAFLCFPGPHRTARLFLCAGDLRRERSAFVVVATPRRARVPQALVAVARHRARDLPAQRQNLPARFRKYSRESRAHSLMSDGTLDAAGRDRVTPWVVTWRRKWSRLIAACSGVWFCLVRFVTGPSFIFAPINSMFWGLPRWKTRPKSRVWSAPIRK